MVTIILHCKQICTAFSKHGSCRCKDYNKKESIFTSQALKLPPQRSPAIIIIIIIIIIIMGGSWAKLSPEHVEIMVQVTFITITENMHWMIPEALKIDMSTWNGLHS